VALFRMAQPAKLATPFAAAMVVPAGSQSRLAPAAPVPVAMPSVTASPAVGTRLPPASTIQASGWVDQAPSAEPPDGCVANTTAAGAPSTTSNPAPVAATRPGLVATRL